MNYDYIQKPDIDLLIRAALDAGATVSKTRFGEEGGIFINGRRLEEGELEELLLHPKPLTNADRIRAMSDEELDKFLGEVQWDVANYCGGVTQKQEYPVPEQRGVWLDWLKQEAEEGE